jgi:hypothetical protein
LSGISFLVIAGFYTLMIIPKLLQHATGLMPKVSGLAAVAAVLLSWRYGYKLLPVIRQQWIRLMIGGVCCLGGVIWIRLYCIYFVPDLLAHAIGAEASLGWFMVSFLWVWGLFAILGGMTYALEKAAQRQDEQGVCLP